MLVLLYSKARLFCGGAPLSKSKMRSLCTSYMLITIAYSADPSTSIATSSIGGYVGNVETRGVVRLEPGAERKEVSCCDEAVSLAILRVRKEDFGGDLGGDLVLGKYEGRWYFASEG